MKLNFTKFVNNFKQPKLWLFVALLVVISFLLPEVALAGLGTLQGYILSVVGYIIFIFVQVIGQLILVVIWVLIAIAQYNNFATSNTVMTGWAIVRDLSNMFFILIMLLVAFGTILRLQGYGIKTLLKSVIIMAVLINFSKLIAGLIIDFAQVIMLTFVNAFKDIGGGNITSMLGIDKLLDVSTGAAKAQNDGDITFWAVVGSFILALIYSLVALVVLVAITVALAMRMIMLWIYVILSPFAYLLAIIPATKSYSSMWWKEFSKNVVVGPVLAFFIWLSLATLGGYKNSGDFYKGEFGKDKADLRTSETFRNENSPLVGASAIGTTDHMISFIISIGLLVGGLMVSQQIGGAAGNAAGKASKRVMAGYKWAGRKTAVTVGKRPAYAVADRTLAVAGAIPLVGSMAIRKRAELNVKREHIDKKDIKYMEKYSDKELKRTRRKGRGKILESTRQDYDRAGAEIMRRKSYDHGSNKISAGKTISEAGENKTELAVDMLKTAGHYLTSTGADAFKNEDLGKDTMDFIKKNVTQMDEGSLRDHYTKLNKQGHNRYDHFEENDLGQPNSQVVEHFAKRMTKKDLEELHPSAMTDRLLNTLGKDKNGNLKASKKLAHVYDNTTEKGQERLDDWARAQPGGVNAVFGDRSTTYGRVGKSFILPNKAKPVGAKAGISGLNFPEKGRVGLDFAELMPPDRTSLNFTPDTAGMYLKSTGEEGKLKDVIVQIIGEELKASGMDEGKVEGIVNTLDNNDHLILRNKAAKVGPKKSRGIQAHEYLHARLDENFTKEERRDIWNQIPEDFRNDASSKIRSQWGEDTPENIVMEEYFAEALRSKTRWDDDTFVTLHPQAEKAMDESLHSKGYSLDAMLSNLTESRSMQEVADTDNRGVVKETLVASASQGSVGQKLASQESQIVNNQGTTSQESQVINNQESTIKESQIVNNQESTIKESQTTNKESRIIEKESRPMPGKESFNPKLQRALENLADSLDDAGNGLNTIAEATNNLAGLELAVDNNSEGLTDQAKAFEENSNNLEKLSKSIKNT